MSEKELIISRIIAGCFKCCINIDNDTKIDLLMYQPTRFQRYLAEEVYHDVLEKALASSSYTDQQLLSFLQSHDLWDDKQQSILDTLIKDIEEFKVNLFQSTFKSEQRKVIRKALVKAKEELLRLNQILHSYDYLSATGVASMAKARYIIAASLHKYDGSKLFNENDLWSVPDYIIEAVAATVSQQKLNELRLREVAHTDPWRSIWMTKKSEGQVFGLPVVDLTDEQRMLSIWSSVYDNIYEHPDCPADDVIDDDDMLDGWMIIQKRKRDSERNSQTVDNMLTNEKIKNMPEIFLPAESVAEARKIEDQNDPGSALLKRQRMNLLRNKGAVNEQDMPDSKMKIREELTKLYVQQAKG